MEIITNSGEETKALGRYIAEFIEPGTIIRLEGPLGAGKTTFTQGLGQGLGIVRHMKSPTYTIVKSYPLAQGQLVHIDAYRLEGLGGDALDLPGLMGKEDIVVIEWAQFIEDDLSEDLLTITLEDIGNDRRKVQLTPSPVTGNLTLMAQLQDYPKRSMV